MNAGVTTTLKWEIPGSVKIQTGSINGPVADIAPDQTEYVFTSENNFGYVYVTANEGYYIVDGTLQSNGRKFTPSNGRLSITCNSSTNNGVVDINCVKLERNDSFKFNVANGAKFMTATFTSSNYVVELENGDNTVPFNPSIDRNLQIVPDNGATTIYKVEYNGTPVEKARYYERWDIPEIASNSTVDVRVFEGEEPVIKDCDLKFEYSQGMENCIYSIRNVTKSTFIMPDEIVGNTITVKSNTILWVSLETDDYNFDRITFNGKDVTGELQNNGSRLVLTIQDEENILRFEGTAKTYDNVIFKGYICNPQGVVLTKERYSGGETVDLSTGESVTSDMDISVDGQPYTLEASLTKSYEIGVSSKNPAIYIAPAEGWYIDMVAMPEKGTSLQAVGSINDSGDDAKNNFYIIARKLENNAMMKMTVVGSAESLMLNANSSKSASWDNPANHFTVKEGEATVDFVARYDDPFSLRSLSATDPIVYVDDSLVGKNEEFGCYYLNCYNGTDTRYYSTVYVNTAGQQPSQSQVTIEMPEKFAEVYHSTAHLLIEKTDFMVLRGSVVYLKLSNPSCNVTVGSQLVYGVDSDGNEVGKLNDDGEVVIPADKGKVSITIAERPSAVLYDITATVPADGAIVKSLDMITVILPVIDENMERMLVPDMNKLGGVTVQREGADPVHVSDLGEAGMAYDANWQPIGFKYPLLLSEPVTVEGKYTITVPEGAFVEGAFVEGDYEMTPLPGGAYTRAYSSTFTVDPTVKEDYEQFILTPVDGDKLHSINTIKIDFPKIAPNAVYSDEFRYDEEGFVYLTNGDDKRACMVASDQSGQSESLVMMIVPIDDQWMQQPVTTAGDWTLEIPEGTFTYKNNPVPAITATYTVDPSIPVYPLSPAPGKVTGSLSLITITFPDAAVVQYNDVAITLEDSEGKVVASSLSALRDDAPNQYVIQFDRLSLSEGDYTLTIPAGAFTLDEWQESEAVTAVYSYAPSWKLTPAPGSELSEIGDFILEFTAASKVEYVGDDYSITLQVGNAFAVSLDCVPVENAQHPAFKLSMPDGSGNPPLGRIEIKVAQGAFLVDGNESDEMYANYVYSKEADLTYVADPASDLVINTDGIYFTFIFGEEFTLKGQPDAADFSVKLAGQQLIYSTDFFVSPEGNMLLMGIVNPDVMKPGKLEVAVAAGAFTLSGTPTPALAHEWNVVEPKEYKVVVTPSDTKVVDDLSKITVSFPDADKAELFNQSFISLARGYAYRADMSVSQVVNADVPTFEITVTNAPTESGEYTFKMYEGAFTLDGAQASPEVEIVYNFDKNAAIDSIIADENGKFTVVTVDGRIVLTEADASMLNSLSTGFYIINGKKVFIRK